ncbi:MAG: hypothetical protein JXR50_02465 [Prolixibacteraceae bacterium]|nr:hypothetical protein [Prolixibacteraceae bacterium]MBN2648583.1 hypothetical protein [Prolixibacteraceae bacterium]
MSAIVIQGNKKDLKLLEKLAQKIGGKVSSLSDEQVDDIIFGKMLDEAKTGEEVSRNTIMDKLK